MSAVSTGARSNDEYRIVRPLGREERGVFLAHDRRLDRAVVLHRLPPDPAARAALLASARALAGVTHPSLCRVHRIREGGEAPCVVQGFERGQRLDSLPTPLSAATVRSLGSALAGALAALHAAGVAHGEVRADRVIVPGSGPPVLLGLRSARANADAQAMLADVEGLVALLNLLADVELRAILAVFVPTGTKRLSAVALRSALDPMTRPPPPGASAVDENPYRGLRPFEAIHAGLFFGRQREIASVLARLRNEPWVLVAAPSGAGKSSLVCAGVVPAIAEIGERDHWDVVTMVPGPRPLSSLAAALAPSFARPADELEASLRMDPALAGRLARGRTDRGLFLFVDQLEEAMTLADAPERDAFLAVLARFGSLAPGVRAIMTLRSDFLDRLGATGTLARDLLRATFVLPPMGADGLRLAIVSPARARSIEFETPAMVNALVAEAGTDADALPLLSFVLAELWTERDRDRHVLPEAALARLGGATAALARHGDTVLSVLSAQQRRAARRVLLALVTSGGERARRTREELVGDGGETAERALEALIRGRLVVAGDAYEIAHEALVRAWPRLRAWLDEASDERAAARRVAEAAAQWERQEHATEALWNDRQLGELDVLAAGSLPPDVAQFVAESRAAVWWATVRRWAWRIGAPLGALLIAASIIGAFRWSERRRTRAFVAARLAEAEVVIREVSALEERVKAGRAEAFARFDASDAPGGEARWNDVLAVATRESSALAAASAPLSLALARDPLDPATRARAADLTYRWLLAAERDHDTDVARDLAARLAQLDDDGSRRARLAAPAHLRVTTDPPGAAVLLHAVGVQADGRRVEDEGHAIELGKSIALPPGSYVLSASAPRRYSTRFPVLLGRAQDEQVEIPLPASADVPQGFVLVPAGVSLLGAADVEGVRAALSAEPEHAVHVDAFAIGAHEVTYAQYLEFLAALPAAERTARRPHAAGLDVSYDTDGVASLTVANVTTRRGDPLCRPKRSVRRCQDWLGLPVAGIAWEDARAYVAWLASGRVPGARLCAEREWERAARGADGRLYAHGDILHAGDADFDETYDVDTDQMGADEVGSFASDRSPFGALDLTGNVAEWVIDQQAGRAARGGHWDDVSLLARAACRYAINVERPISVGLRVCAPAREPRTSL